MVFVEGASDDVPNDQIWKEGGRPYQMQMLFGWLRCPAPAAAMLAWVSANGITLTRSYHYRDFSRSFNQVFFDLRRRHRCDIPDCMVELYWL